MKIMMDKGGAVTVVPIPNTAGQGGLPFITFRILYTDDLIYLEPENLAEVRELQSQIAILAHVIEEENK